MKKSDVIAHFGKPSAVAEALGIDRSAVSQWGENIPQLRAYELEKITQGKLKVKPRNKKLA